MRLLIADDHPLFRVGLRYALTAQGFEIVAEAADGQQALALELRPEVALLDEDAGPHRHRGGRTPPRPRAGVPAALITTFQEPASIQSARTSARRRRRRTSPGSCGP